jgi:hypothetical protein
MKAHDDFIQSIVAAPKDVSLPILEELLADGYSTVFWDATLASDWECQRMHGPYAGGLEDFISGLQHAAPIFEKSHVGCKCVLTIGGDGKPDVHVDYTGRLD